MRVTEVRDLLVLIETYDRTPFRPEAVDTWFEELHGVVAEDAIAAVRKHYRINARDEKGNVRRVLPAEVRRVAEDIGEARRRKAAQQATRRALAGPRPRLGSTGRPDEVEAILAANRARVEAALRKYRDRASA